VSQGSPFGFVQFEFGFLLGPGDGRFLLRSKPEAEVEGVLVLTTLGAPQRRFLSGRKGRDVEEAGAEPVPTSRATVSRPSPFGGETEAEAWLSGLRADADAAEAEVEAAVATLNRAIHAHRAAKADPYARDVSADGALVVRIGYGPGDAVADGHFAQAWEQPRERRRVRRSMEAPEERFAALLGGREGVLACEDLVLRARADLDAGRLREAALQARVGLESLLAELPEIPGGRRPALEADRAAVGRLANAALEGELSGDLAQALADAVVRMESALRARRLGSA
jgi:hypothetical protein